MKVISHQKRESVYFAKEILKSLAVMKLKRKVSSEVFAKEFQVFKREIPRVSRSIPGEYFSEPKFHSGEPKDSPDFLNREFSDPTT